MLMREGEKEAFCFFFGWEEIKVLHDLELLLLPLLLPPT